jgi:hypothetical protein
MDTLRKATLAAAVIFLGTAPARGAEPAPVVPVQPLAKAPSVDGNLADWGSDGWVKVPIQPALSREDRAKYGLEGEDRNTTGKMTLQLKAGVAEGRLFVAARWPDDGADVDFKGWEWSGAKYVESKKRDDMFILRFHLDGDYDRSMLSGKSYRVDLWLWSAARTNPAGLAEDWTHAISGKPIDDAAEYEVKGIGTVYIKKYRDAGTPIYKILRPPKEKGADRVPSFEVAGNASGSVADVAAKGVWKGGFWHLELSRKLNTGNADDLAFKPGQKLQGQVAVFNHNSDENKSVSEPLLFDFSQVR